MPEWPVGPGAGHRQRARGGRAGGTAEHAAGFTTGEQWLAHVRDAFDLLHAEGAEHSRMMSVGLHARLIGRPGRALALARFLDHVERHDRVWICRRVDVARHWMAHHPYRPPG